jgi:hypothetical protein
MPTTISVTEELADELYERKGRGETYEDVIWTLIEQAEEEETPVNQDEEMQPHAETADAPTAPLNEIEELIAQITEGGTLPGRGQKLQERREALEASVDYLRENGTAKPKDFKQDVYPNRSARYTTGEDPPNSWWKNCIYPGLKELAERTDKVEKADETGEWSYTGESQ